MKTSPTSAPDLVAQTPILGGAIPANPKSKTTPRALSIRWIDSVESLEQLIPQWNELVENAIYRNASLEPNFLIPAFKHLSDGNVRILVAEDADSPPTSSTKDGPKALRGIMPLVNQSIYHLPIPCLEVWKHDQCFDSTPLIDNIAAPETLGSMLEFLSEQKIGLLSLNTISAEPEFQTLLDLALSKRGRTLFQRDSFARAAIRPIDNPDQYIKQHVSKSVKKNYGRLSRRLAETGELTCEISDDFSDYDQLTEQFLELEASGWKIETGTALVCSPSTRRFYEELIQRSSQYGKARFLSLKLDGQPIAMLSDLQSGSSVFSYKTAFDENFSTFSPGLQIEMKNIEQMHQSKIEIADSCTDPDNAMINRIWGQKLQFQSVVIGLRPGIAQIATRLMPWIQTVAKKAKQMRIRSK